MMDFTPSAIDRPVVSKLAPLYAQHVDSIWRARSLYPHVTWSIVSNMNSPCVDLTHMEGILAKSWLTSPLFTGLF